MASRPEILRHNLITHAITADNKTHTHTDKQPLRLYVEIEKKRAQRWVEAQTDFKAKM